MKLFHVRPLKDTDRPWAVAFLCQQWGDATIVSRGRVHHADRLPGFIAEHDREPVGLITYHVEGDDCEIVSLDSTLERVGIGSALIAAVTDAVKGYCKRLWLITTNDNMNALRFYQKRGFRLVAVYPGALAQSRQIKPAIPLVGLDGIPLRDEIELDAQIS